MPFRNLLSLPFPLSLTFLLFLQLMCYLRPLTTRLCVTCSTVLRTKSQSSFMYPHVAFGFRQPRRTSCMFRPEPPELHLRVEIQCFCFHSLSPASNLSNKLPLLHGSSIASTFRYIKVLLYHVTKNMNILLWQQHIKMSQWFFHFIFFCLFFLLIYAPRALQKKQCNRCDMPAYMASS